MNEFLRNRILRKLETLSDERLYQVLDYVEFMESKYSERPPAPANVFQRFTDAVEDRLRAGQVSAQTVAETMGLMNRAMGVLSGVAAAGKSVANDIVGATARPGPQRPPTGGGAPAPAASAVPHPPAPQGDGATGERPETTDRGENPS